MTDIATAPPMDGNDDNGDAGASSQYPMLYEMLRANEPRDAPAQDDAPVSSATTLNPHNQCCPMCQQRVTSVIDKPVALLPCGHAYHISCGRMYLSRPEGKECTVPTCHRTENQVEVLHLQRVADAAIARGEFKMEDLQDPVLRRDIMLRLRDLLEDTQHAGDASKTASKAATAASIDDLRSEEAYRVRWRATRVGREGFTFMQKARLLSPYMKNPLVVKKEVVDMARLYELEAQLRRDAQGDEGPSDNASDLAVHVEAAIDGAGDMKDRISVRNFTKAGLTLSDIYFGLELRGWQPLCDAGFTKDIITDKNGAFTLTELADLYAINYASLAAIGWTVDDIVETRHTPQELSNVGLGFREMWTDMSMSRDEFVDLGFSPHKWHDVLGLDKKYLERPLGIGTGELEVMRWTTDEFITAFDLHPMEQRALGLNDGRRAADSFVEDTVAPRQSRGEMRPRKRRVGASEETSASTSVPALHRRPKTSARVLSLESGRT